MSVRVDNLTKYYGPNLAVDNISFDVEQGEILGFLGPNGAGKTTTMKIITCFMPPNSGEVEVDGYNIKTHSMEVRKRVGYLPEMNPLYDDMNVMDFLRYAAKLQGVRGPELSRRMKEMIDICGIGDVRHKDIAELSKGYKQRVGLAQAMAHNPDILILDEPTIGLDPNQIVEIRNLIKRLGAAKTVILSTHILPEVQATCDRAVIINKGKIVADGSIDTLIDQFKGADLINLEIKAEVEDPLKEIVPKFNGIEDIEKVEYVKSENGSFKFNVSSTSGVDLREQIFNLAVESGWVLLEMNREETSLEEVFHKLTQSSGGSYGEGYFQDSEKKEVASGEETPAPKESEETKSDGKEDANKSEPSEEDPHDKYKPKE